MINSINLNTQELLKQAQNGDSNAVNQLCQGIYNATAGKLGTDEEYINTIMQNADSKTLAGIMDMYSDVTGSEIYKDIENDFSGKAEKEILSILENAYKEVNNEEYTDDNDGKLSIDQKAQSVGKGLLNKTPDIALTVGGVALAKSAIGACISGTATTALTAVFGTAAATVATIAAPVLAGVGLVTAGVMTYKGVTQTAQAIEDGQNATTDDVAQNALQEGTEGFITTGLGVYTGCNSAKALNEAVGKINTQINDKKEIEKLLNYNQEIRQKPEKIILNRNPVYDCDIPYKKDSYYRGIGETGYQDFLETNSLRARQNTKVNYDVAYFESGKVNNIYVRNPSAQAYIAETNSSLIIEESGSYPHAKLIPSSEPMRIWHKNEMGGYEIVYDTMNDIITRNPQFRYNGN